MAIGTHSPELRHEMDACGSATNYLSVGQICLYDIPLLREPPEPSHVKLAPLWRWGAALKRLAQDMLVEHERHIDRYGQDMPESLGWEWVLPSQKA